MPKFRKKPVVIEAVLLTRRTIYDVYCFVYGKPDVSDNISSDKWDDYENLVREKGMKIPTLEGEMVASMGDYVIKGIKGEIYPCKPDIFEATYELVKD